jgi:hypothetical protein
MAKVAIILIIFIVVIVVISIIIGDILWGNYTSNLTKELIVNNKEIDEHVNFDELSSLPKPVQKYFKLVLKDGAPIINRVTLTQHGEFRINLESEEWLNMNAIQNFTNGNRGFVWSATITIFSPVNVKVIDSYINGKGAMKGKVLSLITVIDEREKKELNKAALQRYLAESVWFPTALLPTQGVKWTGIDEKKASATINDSGITVSLVFGFNDKGEIVEVYTSERYREVKGEYILFPWKGEFSNYVEIGDYRIPSRGEVAWILEDGTFPYLRANIKQVDFD